MKTKKIIAWLVGIIATLSAVFSIIVLTIVVIPDSIIENRLLKEVSKIPEVSVKIRHTFEGATLADMEILNKGNVTILYGLFGLEDIRRIDRFNTVFICPEDRNVGIGFTLAKNSKFKKWFPFEVKNLKELVSRYDDIVAILEEFPTSPDPNYTVTAKSRSGETVKCSVYFNQ